MFHSWHNLSMLLVRPDQLEEMEVAARHSLVQRIEGYLRTRHADCLAPFPPHVVPRMIERGIARAQRNGLTWQSSIALFVSTMFRIAPNFDEYPSIRGALQRGEGTADERMLALIDRIRPADWRGALKRYDLSAWAK